MIILGTLDDVDLLEQARHSPWRGRLPVRTHAGLQTNVVCGDEVSLELLVADGLLQDVRFEGRGCFLSQATASLLCKNVIGQPVESLGNSSLDELLGFDVHQLLSLRRICASLAHHALLKALSQPSTF